MERLHRHFGDRPAEVTSSHHQRTRSTFCHSQELGLEHMLWSDTEWSIIEDVFLKATGRPPMSPRQVMDRIDRLDTASRGTVARFARRARTEGDRVRPFQSVQF